MKRVCQPAVFGFSTPRFKKESTVPGPGSYSPNYDAIRPRVHNGAFARPLLSPQKPPKPKGVPSPLLTKRYWKKTMAEMIQSYHTKTHHQLDDELRQKQLLDGENNFKVKVSFGKQNILRQIKKDH